MALPSMTKGLLLLVLSAQTLIAATAASKIPRCPCGYTLQTTILPNNTSNSTPREPVTTNVLFTDVLETDFLHVYDLPTYANSTAERIAAFGWHAQAFNVSAADARGPYGKAAEVRNVGINPVRSEWNWGGEGLGGGDPGLKLWVRGGGDLLDGDRGGDERGQMIRTAELAALREDVVFGSFRVGMKMSGVAGTCAAFFWYRNDTSELDLEFLSRQLDLGNSTAPAVLNLVLQTPLSASRGFDASTTPYFRTVPLPFVPSDGYHEYRVDWLPDSVTFFADGVPLWTVTDQNVIPREPGHLILNHWSNGDAKWSGGPPGEDAVLTVSYVKAYFNSSDEARERNFTETCAAAAPAGGTCDVMEADWTVGIDPRGENGNVTGRTPFVDDSPGWTVKESSPDGGEEGGSTRQASWSSELMVMLVAVLIGIHVV